MGAEPYDYIVDYEVDIQAALDKLRQQVFENGTFNGAENNPASPEEALEMTEADGTRSILDITTISDQRDLCTASPLTAAECRKFFQTEKPTLAMIRHCGDFWGSIGRGTARYVVLYKDGKPRNIFFAGYSYD